MTRSRPPSRLMLLGICLTLVLLHCPTADAQNPLTHLTAARVYAAPDRDALPIGLVENGQLLQILSRAGDFWRIDCHDLEGYIHKNQVCRKQNRYYVNCAVNDPDTQYIPTLKPLDMEQLRRRVLALAHAQLGDIYIYGGQSPGGFDCSGLMEYVFHHSGFDIPRTADPQMAAGLIVAPEDMLPGDLVFFNNPEESSEFITHVGLYIGEGNFLHASVSGGVCIRSLAGGYFAEHFVCARRVLNPGAYSVPSYHYLTLN